MLRLFANNSSFTRKKAAFSPLFHAYFLTTYYSYFI